MALIKKIIHPSYLGLLLIYYGLSIAMNSEISFFVISIPIYIAIIYRIKLEESILIKEFGDLYRQYILNSQRLFPI